MNHNTFELQHFYYPLVFFFKKNFFKILTFILFIGSSSHCLATTNIPSILSDSSSNYSASFSEKIYSHLKEKIQQKLTASTFTSFTCNAGADEISGIVFEDYNFNGINDGSSEMGRFEGVLVTATDSLDNVLTTSTDANGNYIFTNLLPQTTYRIEFNIPETLSWAQPTIFQADNGTTVQFVTSGNCANLGAATPDDFCETNNPPVMVSCFEPGTAVYGATGNENKGIISFPYQSSGTINAPTEIAKIYETGTVWGLAWQKSTQRLFTSSFLKRHSGFGALGAGGIYVTEYLNGVGNVVASFDLQGVVPANGGGAIDLGTVDRSSGADFILPDNNDTKNRDLDAFDKIGKMSFGDIDLSLDGRTLWLTNLKQNTIISVDVSDPNNYPGTINQYSLNTMTGLPTCTNGTLRPWGLGMYKNKAYLGCVCTGENNGSDADLYAYVLSFDPKLPTSVTIELDFALDYKRENATDFPNLDIGVQSSDWQPWISDWAGTGFSNNPTSELAYPQPVLSDIDFTQDGSMVVGLADRWGFQLGYRDYIPVSGNTNTTSANVAGDIIKACFINGQYVLEGTSGACSVNDSAANSALDDDGPSGNGEFFYQDAFNDTAREPLYNHNETFIGSFGVLKGANELIATHFDPIDGARFAFDLGILWHDITDGSRTNELRIVESGASQSKGNNLGDLALVCNGAPIEIGNYVWLDSDSDGIQDAGEKSLANIRLELYNENGDLLAFDITDANGQYYFSKDGQGSQSWVNSNGSLSFDETYYIAVSGTQFSNNAITIDAKNYQVTTDSTANGINRFLIDNDAEVGSGFSGNLNNLNGLPITSITTSYTGIQDHSFDIGFSPACIQSNCIEINTHVKSK